MGDDMCGLWAMTCAAAAQGAYHLQMLYQLALKPAQIVNQTVLGWPVTDAPTTTTALGLGWIGKAFGVKLQNLDIF